MSIATKVREDSYSPREVSEITGFSLSTINRRLKDGSLRSRKIGGRIFITREDVETFMIDRDWPE